MATDNAAAVPNSESQGLRRSTRWKRKSAHAMAEDDEEGRAPPKKPNKGRGKASSSVETPPDIVVGEGDVGAQEEAAPEKPRRGRGREKLSSGVRSEPEPVVAMGEGDVGAQEEVAAPEKPKRRRGRAKAPSGVKSEPEPIIVMGEGDVGAQEEAAPEKPEGRGNAKQPNKDEAAKTAETTTTETATGARPTRTVWNRQKAKVPAPPPPRPWFWLMKAEPETRLENGRDVSFSIDDLAAKTEPEGWDGIRSYSARNNLREMEKGELAFFYHSNCKVPGIVGIMRIVAEATADETQFDPESAYHDPLSTRENPRWSLVHVSFVEKFPAIIPLETLKRLGKDPDAPIRPPKRIDPDVVRKPLADLQMLLMPRLSVSKVGRREWEFLLEYVRLRELAGSSWLSAAGAKSAKKGQAVVADAEDEIMGGQEAPADGPSGGRISTEEDFVEEWTRRMKAADAESAGDGGNGPAAKKARGC